MHGFVNRSIQLFIAGVYGGDTWLAVADGTRAGRSEYSALQCYPRSETEDLLCSAARVLKKPQESLLEDLGTWLVTTPSLPVRRLLRIGGTNFTEFLHSLDDLPGRARLAVNGLEFPSVELREHSTMTYSVIVNGEMPGLGPVLTGVLRAMADEYGVLALFDEVRGCCTCEVVSIRLVQTDYSAGRAFELASPP